VSPELTTTRPLAGRVILVTRAREQAGRFAALLEEAGGQVLLVPTIAIEPPESWTRLDDALGRAREYHWMIFTSVNAVDMVRRRLEAAGAGVQTLAGCRIAAIGPATASALSTWGLRPEVIPDAYVAEALVDRLRPLVRPGERVLLPRAAEAREVLARELRGMGAVVDEVAAYHTRPARERVSELRAALVGRRVDVVSFTSSSTVRSFAALFEADELRRLLAGVTVACIGPITRATAAAHALPTHVMPETYTIPALARAIVAYYDARR